ncbi:hypothetical protein NAT51_15275 [Flavobacterium amniphilum]|uniref:hypothetical protein n=1 Tax=Flavobacterium amniphilum TaxID=1834035 RepID=UPI00202A338E|nr:hypothetical protein [Flavobacterium amniphilum]MCL9806896.1 hypothetical protein [Flavobacterium amniphilum]
MQLFPTKNYTIELKDSPEKSIELLKLNTMLSDSLSTQTTDKKFIGRINGNRFEIISSEIGIGAFTVLRGNFSDDSVTLVAEVNKPFKILISILSILALGGISYNAFKIGFPGGFGMLVPLLMFLGLLRFVFLGSFFERSFRLVFGKFTGLLQVKPTQIKA